MPLFPTVNKCLAWLFQVIFLFLAGEPAWAQLKADFTADKPGGCSPLSVSFTNTSTGASVNATYSWDLGNGRTSVLPNPGSVYTNEQTYTITLTVKDGSQTSIKSLTVTVYKKPSVDFSATPAQVCLPLPVTFNSNSLAGDGALANYFWDFGDGATQSGSGLGQVGHTYTFAQSASVSLIVTNNYGCYNSLQKMAVVISPAIKAGFTADKTTLCQAGDAVQFSNTSTGGTNCSWDFGDGTQSTDANPLHSFSQKGDYTIALTVTSPGGCNDVSKQVNLIHVADFTTDFSVPNPVCLYGAAPFTDKSVPAPGSSIWRFDDGGYWPYTGAAYHSFSTTGPHTVTLTNMYGACPQTITKPVTVQEVPSLKDFIVTLESACGAPVKVDFADTSTTAVQWLWNFNSGAPGASSTVRAPSYIYTAEGIFYPQLTITNSAGCSATTSKPVNTIKPVVFVTYKNSTSASGNISCSAFSMTFTASSGNDPINGYHWDFGDGGSSTDAEPVHVFSIPGSYIVHLSYTTAGGCQGVAEYSSVRLYQKPVANFTIAPGTTICGNTPVHFIDQSQGPVSTWTWNPGDNSPLLFTSGPVYRYSADGVYTITLTVSNDLCSDRITKTIQVLPPFPHIDNYANTCDDTRGLVVFRQHTIKGMGWNWDFGDGSTLPLNIDQPAVQHVYTRTGVYKTVLTAVNGSCSVRDSIFTSVLLKQHPVLSTSRSTTCASDILGVNILNLEVNPAQYDYYNPYSYTLVHWQYSDLSNFTGSYTPPGIVFGGISYSGSLSGLANGESGLRAILTEDGFGCKDTTNLIPLTIKGPTAGYTVTTNNVCVKSPVVFEDASYGNNSVPILSWTWSFGDGQTQSAAQGGTVAYTYSDPGYYYPILTVTDKDGCSAASPYPAAPAVQVDGPKAAFSWYPSIVSPGTMLFFYNTTNTTGAGNTQYQWDFGDGSGTANAYPSHSYSSTGTDTVKLIAQNASPTCRDTSTQVIYVKTIHTSFTYTTSFVNNNRCPPVILHFTNTSINANSVSWNFGDGSIADNQGYPSHTYYRPGLFRVVLYGSGNNGATDSTVNLISIKGPFATLRSDTLSGCTGQTVTLSALVNNALSFTWDFGDGTLSKTKDTFAVHSYLTGGLYTPALIMQDADGCQATSGLDKPILIDSLHIALPNMPPHICDSSLLILNADVQSIAAGLGASGPGGPGLGVPGLGQPLRYKWDFGTGVAGDTSDLESSSFTWHHPGQYPVSLRVTSPFGCVRNVTKTLLVADPQPFQLKVTRDTFACPGMPLQLEAGGAASYRWLAAPGLGDLQVRDPLATAPLQSSYTVVGYDQYACFADTATVHVILMPSPTVNAGPDIQIPTGSTLSLNATGSPDVTQWRWSPPDYLSCADCPSPICVPRSSLQYIVTGKTQYGCPAADTLRLKLICDEGRVYISNSFTPNGDGKNDVFYIKGRGVRIINYLRIFNRWGEVIFERSHFNIDDRSAGWDGRFRGEPVESGTYVYVTELVCDSGEVFPLKGTFTIVR